MIGAADLAGVEGITDRRQFVTPMTTHIGEGAQGSIRISAEKDALAANIDGTKLTRGDELVETPYTIPGRLPEMLSLPGQDILGEVDVGRECETRTEWIEDSADLFRVNRCRIHPDSLLPPWLSQCILNSESGYRKEGGSCPPWTLKSRLSMT